MATSVILTTIPRRRARQTVAARHRSSFSEPVSDPVRAMQPSVAERNPRRCESVSILSGCS